MAKRLISEIKAAVAQSNYEQFVIADRINHQLVTAINKRKYSRKVNVGKGTRLTSTLDSGMTEFSMRMASEISPRIQLKSSRIVREEPMIIDSDRVTVFELPMSKSGILTHESLSKLDIKTLQQIAQQMQLGTTGLKADIINRILTSQQENY